MPRKTRAIMNAPSPRLLDVSVSAIETSGWQWRVCENDLTLLTGYERSRDAAQKQGDDALFRLLSI